MRNLVVEVDGKLYHPEQFASPIDLERPNGERVQLPGYEGLWVRLIPRKGKFTFKVDPSRTTVTVTGGYRTEEFNGNTQFPLDLLVWGEDSEVKAAMKAAGRPSCVRDNLKHDLLRFIEENREWFECTQKCTDPCPEFCVNFERQFGG